MANLAHLLTDNVAERADRPAFRVDENVVSYGALDDASRRVAALLRANGLAAGDRVGIMLPNVPYFPIIFYGVLRLGAVMVPMNPLLKDREVAYYLGDSEAKAIFAWHGFADDAAKGAAEVGAQMFSVTPGEFDALLASQEPLPGLVERAGEDTAVVLYTSGTTGKPKGAELTHDNLVANTEVTVNLITLGPDDVVFGGLPLFHVFGLTCGMNTVVSTGACLTLLPRFEPTKTLEIFQRDKVTVMEGVPTMYTALLQHPNKADYDTSSLRVCVSGGAALPVEVLRGFEAAYDCVILEGYGLSETSPVASFNHPDRERKPGSIGTPVAGVEFRLIGDDWADVPEGEVGEIAIKGHNVMKGYLNRPDATAEAVRDGWFRTGDMATRDEDGYYFIVDRKKDMIIRGGYNVYPREIEEVLYEHPAVAQAAVIGVPHSSLGEEVGAAVVLKAGASATVDELRDFLKERLAAYKYPRKVWLVDALPLGPTGKILKREIVPPDEIVS
jgi:long-chain acyl-CoA synthetase